jgi:hypothetical protein
VSARIGGDAAHAGERLETRPPTSDVDAAWERLQRDLPTDRPQHSERPRFEPVGPRRPRGPRLSLRAGVVVGAIGIVVAGTAAAATLTTVFAPTHVAPLSVSRGDMRALAAFVGLDGSHSVGGFSSPNGSTTTRFGRIAWSQTGTGQPAASLAQASALAGFPVAAPTHLPVGVGSQAQFVLQPRVAVTVTFNSGAGSLSGSSVTLSAGPAVVAKYAGASATGGAPILAVLTMPRPTARSTGATIGQIEAFMLRQPGIPPELAQEIRLLGSPATTLPVPVPSGASVHSVRLAGGSGVLVADPSNAASAVVWQGRTGTLHIVAGILDSSDVLNVADQLG